MTVLSIEHAIEAIYASLNDFNRDIDLHISALKAALAAAGKKEALFDPARLAQNNRQGRKLMESYFRQRGVRIGFVKAAAETTQ